MIELYEYLEAALLVSPLLFFIVAVTFRLLDNSGSLFLQKEIIIESSYVSLKILQDQLRSTPDETFRKCLKQVLIYRRLHSVFIILMILSLPFSLWFYFSL